MSENKEIIRTGLFDVVEVKNDNNVLQLFHQRVNDGYVNATELCKYAGKKFSHYYARPETKEFLQVLSSDAHISASELVGASTNSNTFGSMAIAIVCCKSIKTCF